MPEQSNAELLAQLQQQIIEMEEKNKEMKIKSEETETQIKKLEGDNKKEIEKIKGEIQKEEIPEPEEIISVVEEEKLEPEEIIPKDKEEQKSLLRKTNFPDFDILLTFPENVQDDELNYIFSDLTKTRAEEAKKLAELAYEQRFGVKKEDRLSTKIWNGIKEGTIRGKKTRIAFLEKEFLEESIKEKSILKEIKYNPETKKYEKVFCEKEELENMANMAGGLYRVEETNKKLLKQEVKKRIKLGNIPLAIFRDIIWNYKGATTALGFVGRFAVTAAWGGWTIPFFGAAIGAISKIRGRRLEVEKLTGEKIKGLDFRKEDIEFAIKGAIYGAAFSILGRTIAHEICEHTRIDDWIKQLFFKPEVKKIVIMPPIIPPEESAPQLEQSEEIPSEIKISPEKTQEFQELLASNTGMGHKFETAVANQINAFENAHPELPKGIQDLVYKGNVLKVSYDGREYSINISEWDKGTGSGSVWGHVKKFLIEQSNGNPEEIKDFKIIGVEKGTGYEPGYLENIKEHVRVDGEQPVIPEIKPLTTPEENLMPQETPDEKLFIDKQLEELNQATKEKLGPLVDSSLQGPRVEDIPPMEYIYKEPVETGYGDSGDGSGHEAVVEKAVTAPIIEQPVTPTKEMSLEEVAKKLEETRTGRVEGKRTFLNDISNLFKSNVSPEALDPLNKKSIFYIPLENLTDKEKYLTWMKEKGFTFDTPFGNCKANALEIRDDILKILKEKNIDPADSNFHDKFLGNILEMKKLPSIPTEETILAGPSLEGLEQDILETGKGLGKALKKGIESLKESLGKEQIKMAPTELKEIIGLIDQNIKQGGGGVKNFIERLKGKDPDFFNEFKKFIVEVKKGDLSSKIKDGLNSLSNYADKSIQEFKTKK